MLIGFLLMEKWTLKAIVLCIGVFGVVYGPASLGAQTVGTVTILESSDADQLNPYTNFSATGSYINEYLFFSLLRTHKSTGEFLPLLADDFPSVSEDRLQFTYELHAAAKFNSGKKVLARDVAFSLKIVKNPYVNNSQKRVHYDNIAEAVVNDDRSVTLRLKKMSPQGMRVTSDFAILSEAFFDPDHTLDAIRFADLNAPKSLGPDKVERLRAIADKVNAYGTSQQNFDAGPTCGPYVLNTWQPEKQISLVANKKFWGKKAGERNCFFGQNVGEIQFRIISEEDRIRTAIFNGEVDMVTSVPPQLYFELSDIPKLQDKFSFHEPPSQSYEYVGMNIKGSARDRKPFFADAKVRRAIAHAIDVDLLLERVCYGLGERIAAEYPAQQRDFRNAELPLRQHDPKAAKQFLADAGWRDSDENGLLDKEIDGESVTFVVECIYNANKPQRKIIAEELQRSARELGVLVSLVELPWKDYLKRLKAGEFDLCIGAWVADPNEDTYRQIWHSQNWGSGSNFIGFGDAESDALIDQYDETFDVDQRREISKQIQEVLYERQPYVFLWANTNSLVISKRFEKAPMHNLRPGFWVGEWE